MLEKTLEWFGDYPEQQRDKKLINSKGNQPWIFIGRTDAEVEALILWPPDAKSWLIEEDPDAGKDWRQEEKGMTRGWDGWMASDSGRWWRTGKPGVLQPMGLQRVGHHWETEQQLCFQQGCVPSLSASWIHGSRAGILPLLIIGHPSQHPPPDGPISLLEELKLSIALARADFLTTFSPHVSWVSTLYGPPAPETHFHLSISRAVSFPNI